MGQFAASHRQHQKRIEHSHTFTDHLNDLRPADKRREMALNRVLGCTGSPVAYMNSNWPWAAPAFTNHARHEFHDQLFHSPYFDQGWPSHYQAETKFDSGSRGSHSNVQMRGINGDGTQDGATSVNLDFQDGRAAVRGQGRARGHRHGRNFAQEAISPAYANYSNDPTHGSFQYDGRGYARQW